MNIIQNKEQNIYVEQFNSVQEFVKYISTARTNAAFRKKYGDDLTQLPSNREEVCEDDEDAWRGTKTMDKAAFLLKHGYKDGVKNLTASINKVRVINDISKINTRRSVVGGAPCVPAVIMGLPKTMYRRTKTQIKQPVVNIYYDRSAGSSLESQDLVRGGQMIYQTVQALERQNVRVNLYIIIGTTTRKKSNELRHAFATIKVKSAEMPINPQLVSYPIIHTAFFRRHVFRWIEVSAGTSYTGYTNGYGMATRDAVRNITQLLLRGHIISPNDYYLDCVNAMGCKTVEDVLLRMGLQL